MTLISQVFLFAVLAFSPLSPVQAGTRVGFVDPTLPEAPARRDAAALAFAKTQGEVTRLRPLPDGGWQGDDKLVHAPEEFDVLWYNEAERGTISLGERADGDLLLYLQNGGTLLLSGAASALVNDLGIEPTPMRVLGPTEAAYASGFLVQPKCRSHPGFAGFDTSKPVLLSTVGGNALADFYGTAGPHGDLLAGGNAGVGERAVVEYTVGAGRVILVGWRLADFTTSQDKYRPNLERFYGNLLHYLAGRSTNHAQIVRPPGKATYARLLGVPFLCAAKLSPLAVSPDGRKTAAVLTEGAKPGVATAHSFPVGAMTVSEVALSDSPLKVNALAVTLLDRAHGVADFVAARRAEQAEVDERDRELLRGLKVVTPEVRFEKAPLEPLKLVEPDRSVLLGRSAFMAPGDGTGDIEPVYQPLEDGGFRIAGSSRKFNRPIVEGQNRVWSGDVPIFRMDTVTGNGSYAHQERVFPLWPRPDAEIGNVNPCLGTLRLGVKRADGGIVWLDSLKCEATFRPGYTLYVVTGPEGEWTASIAAAAALDSHGLICHVRFDKAVPLVWQYGGIWWVASEANANRVEITGNVARITEPNLPNGLVLAGWNGQGEGHAAKALYGNQAEFTASAPQQAYDIVATWGVTSYDEARASATLARLDTPNDAAWPKVRDHLKQEWFDGYIGRALRPEEHLKALLGGPEGALKKTMDWWDRRRGEFQIHTPDVHLDALMNWSRCTTEYHRQGPGLVLGAQIWQMYSHISTGWYGKQWGGDHQAMDDCLRFYGAMQGEDGFVRWISPSLVAFHAEDNTPYWVDQVWRHYTWTGDEQFVRDLWPMVRKAVAWMQKHNDPDGDALFRDSYEYWNCDSHGKGPKSATPSAMAWAMLDRAARMAKVVGDADAARQYRAAADKTSEAIFRELWRDDEGRLGSIGADGIWQSHPQTWNEYLAVNAGLLSPEQGRRAMRWVASHLGFEPQPGVHLLSNSDWWPIRWSIQWVPTGDTCLAALAGMKCGDADLWYPYLKTVVGSAFRSEFPGINMGISNAGAGGGDREDVDSVDPHVHCAVRGLFGIEPRIDEGQIAICPSFPSAWTDASVRTPDIRYEYHREGQKATVRIHTPRPLVKRVKANLAGAEVATPAETDSVVTVQLGPPAPPLQPSKEPPILVDPKGTDVAQRFATDGPVVREKEAGGDGHQVLFDLAAACNKTVEGFIATRFIYDYADSPQPIVGWWGNPTMTMPPSPRVVEAPSGIRFLTSGHPRPGIGAPPKHVIALSSWRPYPLPGGATISVNAKCRRLYLLLQNYVHPMKNYLPNGEVVLRYADGTQAVTSLIPPYNLDCYFQHFSLDGEPVPFGRLGPWPGGWTPIDKNLASAHADALAIPCDPSRELRSVELRATCSEGAIGLAGMTAVEVESRP